MTDTNQAFLMALFPEWPAGVFAEVRALKDEVWTQHWERSATGILDRARRLSPTHDVYFGVNPRRGRNGTKDAVAYVGAFHVDMDCPLEDALDRLHSFPLAPSAVVSSGHGAHVYWLLTEPFTIESVDDVRRVEAINRGVANALHGDRGAWDASRVLRVPGTISYKRGGVPVELIEFDAALRYEPSDFEELGLDALPSNNAPPVAFLDQEPDGGAAIAKAEANGLSARTWRLITQGHPPSTDRSSGDFGACCALVRSGLSDDEIRAIFKSHPIGAKYREADAGDRYLARTLGKARGAPTGANKHEKDPNAQRENLRRAKDVVRQWLLLDDDNVVDVVLAVPVANAAAGDPVWVIIVAASSSAKTELIRALSDCPQVYALSALTDRTFASGFQNPQQTSLLHKLRTGQTLTLKDFGSILSMRPDAKAEVLGQLREIYDGKYRKAFGTGQELAWEGRLGLLTASTPAIERHHGVIGELGERFLWFRLSTPESQRAAIANVALEETGQEAQMREEIAKAFLDVIGDIDPETVNAVICPQEMKVKLAAAADLATWLRTPVTRDRFDKTIEYQPLPEGPARMAKALLRFGKGLAAVRGQDTIDSDIVELLVKVALDSVPPKRLAAVRHLAALDGWERTRKIGLRLRLPTSSATVLLEDLAALEVVAKRIERKDDHPAAGGSESEDAGEGRAFEWRLRDVIAGLLVQLELPGEEVKLRNI